MTDRELGDELSRTGAEKTPRRQEVVNEMKARGQQFFEATPPASGIGVSGDIPVRPGVSVTGTIAQDPRNGHVITGGGVKLGKPSAPQFSGIAPRPDGLNAETNTTAKFGDTAEFSERLTLNVAPDLAVSGSYRAKGTVTMPDGRSFEVEVVIERRPDGTWNTTLPDGIKTTTPLPGGGTIGTTLPGDPTTTPSDPQLKGPKPGGPKQPAKRGLSFDLSGTITLDKEFTPNAAPPPTAQEVQRALRHYSRAQQEQRQRTENCMAQNRQEALRRQADESAAQRAEAAEAARRAALPDRDRDQIPDQEDATPNQNDTDPASTDLGDGPESNPGYASDEAPSSPRSQPPASTNPNADFDHDSIPDRRDGTWNQNDTDPASTDLGDGPEGNPGYGGPGSPNVGLDHGSDTPSRSTVDTDHDGISDANDSTPNQNDTDPASTDIGDGPEGNAGYGGSGSSSSSDRSSSSGSDTSRSTGSNTSGSSGTSSPTGSDTPGSSGVDTDHDGISDANDSTPNQNDTDPASTDVGDGPEGNPGYGGGSGSDPGSCLCS